MGGNAIGYAKSPEICQNRVVDNSELIVFYVGVILDTLATNSEILPIPTFFDASPTHTLDVPCGGTLCPALGEPGGPSCITSPVRNCVRTLQGRA